MNACRGTPQRGAATGGRGLKASHMECQSMRSSQTTNTKQNKSYTNTQRVRLRMGEPSWRCTTPSGMLNKKQASNAIWPPSMPVLLAAVNKHKLSGSGKWLTPARRSAEKSDADPQLMDAQRSACDDSPPGRHRKRGSEPSRAVAPTDPTVLAFHVSSWLDSLILSVVKSDTQSSRSPLLPILPHRAAQSQLHAVSAVACPLDLENSRGTRQCTSLLQIKMARAFT